MKITTEAHGAFPTMSNLAESGPRIAFLNSDDQCSYLRASMASKNVLILNADDISEDAIPGWLQKLLQLPPAISNITKHHMWRSSRKQGFPSSPMSYGDGVAILNFFRALRASGAEHLVISCEYGKSRSVTTASFLREHVLAESDKHPYPNTWVRKMLHLAKEKNDSDHSNVS